jgi:hypothetical protein
MEALEVHEQRHFELNVIKKEAERPIS